MSKWMNPNCLIGAVVVHDVDMEKSRVAPAYNLPQTGFDRFGVRTNYSRLYVMTGYRASNSTADLRYELNDKSFHANRLRDRAMMMDGLPEK